MMVGRTSPSSAAPVPPSATTSPSIRRSAWRAAPARATACCSTSATRRNPVRIGAVADSNFSYWHSATFNNDGTKILFSDEWGGGGAAQVPRDATRRSGARTRSSRSRTGKMQFQSYYKLPAPQTRDGELRGAQRLADPDPGPRRDGAGLVPGRHLGLRLDRRRRSPIEIAFFDRGPVDSDRAGAAAAPGRCTGTTAYIVSSEIARGLDIFELTPSALPLAERDRRGQDGAAATTSTRRGSRRSSGRRASRWRARTSTSSSGRTDSRARRSARPGRRSPRPRRGRTPSGGTSSTSSPRGSRPPPARRPTRPRFAP